MNDAFTSQGLMLGAFGLRAAHILQAQKADSVATRYLDEMREWLEQGVECFSSPDDCCRALRNFDGEAHLSAILARERLRIGFGLRRFGYLQGDLDAWFAAVGLADG